MAALISKLRSHSIIHSGLKHYNGDGQNKPGTASIIIIISIIIIVIIIIIIIIIVILTTAIININITRCPFKLAAPVIIAGVTTDSSVTS